MSDKLNTLWQKIVNMIDHPGDLQVAAQHIQQRKPFMLVGRDGEKLIVTFNAETAPEPEPAQTTAPEPEAETNDSQTASL